MRTRYYHVSRDENAKCDDEKCGGEAVIECFREGKGWERVMFFEEQPNLYFLKKCKRQCKKCGKVLEIKYKPHKYSDEL